jgi:hypothetical protein
MIGLTNNSSYATLDTNPYALAPNARNYDGDDAKVLLWTLGFDASDTMGFAFNGIYGGDCATQDPTLDGFLGAPGGCGITISNGRLNVGDNDDQLLLDLTMNWDPSDKLSTWVNVDYMQPMHERRPGSPYLFGIAAAGRYGITDTTGLALRLEYIYSNDQYLGMATAINPATIFVDGPPAILPSPAATLAGYFKEDQTVWTVTATLDHALTEHLSIKGEVVYQEGDTSHNTDNQYFCNKSCNANQLDRRQILLGAQMTYEF